MWINLNKFVFYPSRADGHFSVQVARLCVWRASILRNDNDTTDTIVDTVRYNCTKNPKHFVHPKLIVEKSF